MHLVLVLHHLILQHPIPQLPIPQLPILSLPVLHHLILQQPIPHHLIFAYPLSPPLLPSAAGQLREHLPAMAAVAQATGAQAVKTLPEVVNGLKAWIMGILATVATLFLVIGGLRYMTAAGDPAAVEQAKGSLKAALTGYALAVLAPVILQVLQGILGV